MSHYPQQPAYSAPSYSYQSAQTPSSYLRDPMDRFSNPGAGGYQYSRKQPLPPAYDADGYPRKSGAAASSVWWNPLSWRTRTRIIVGVVASIIVLAIIIGAAVGVTRANRYPDYSPLSYSIADTYQGSNFYSNFDYWDTYDPAEGFVHYDNPTDAANRNLTGYDTSSQTAYLKVDNVETDASTGRHSARVYTRTTYDSGLFLFDVAHAPYGCASWPAVWLTNQANWPNDGEIDVIEAFNKAATGNQMTLHTTNGCSMSSVKRKMSGAALQGNCYNGTNSNAGCGVKAADSSYGSAFNARGGGVYAMELRDAGIRMWLFYRDSIPSDITAGTAPDPSTWGEALADFPSTDCDISTHFKNLSIVANIDVCGQAAGSTKVYTDQDQCPGLCTTYAANNPSAFDEAYWSWNYFKVFKAA